MEKTTPLVGAKNVSLRTDDKVLFMYMDLSNDFGPSSSGKTVVVASSCGNKPLGSSNAFLGLNLFTKSLEKRDLGDKATSALRTAEFQPVGEGCAWRFEAASTVLCIKIDFAQCMGRTAGSGKSVLLATTGGNKPIAETGVMCGLNCYHAVNASFAADKLVDAATTAEVAPGESRELGDGFTLDYSTTNTAAGQPRQCVVVVRYTLRAAGQDDASPLPVVMPSCRVAPDITLSLTIAAPKPKRARKEPPTSSEAAVTTSEGATIVKSEGGVGGLDADARASSVVRNLVVGCCRCGVEAGMSAPGKGWLLTFTVNPAASFGRSASGKSLTVASSGGFQGVCDEAGMAVCRVNFNAYRPAAPLTEAEIEAAAARVVAGKSRAELDAMTLKTALLSILTELGLNEKHESLIKDKAKAALKTIMSRPTATE